MLGLALSLPSVFKIRVQQDPVLSLPAHISCVSSTGFVQSTNKFFGAGNIFVCFQTTHRKMELILAGGDRSGHDRKRQYL